MLFKKLNGVIAKACLQVIELAFWRRVGAELIDMGLGGGTDTGNIAHSKQTANSCGQDQSFLHGFSPLGLFIIVIKCACL